MKIDVHAHYLPETYRAALAANGHEQPDGFPYIPEWSVDEHLGVMDRLGIERSLLSVSSPGVIGDPDLARLVNDEGQKAVVDHPKRFGLLASLPLPNVDAAMAELDRCGDADGYVLLTNHGGTYVGDITFAPVLDALNARRALVLLHPTSPPCFEHTSLGRPRPMIEFLFDTTRAVADLVLNGTIARCPDLRLIVPHAGATLPILADRVSAFAAVLAPDVDVLADLRRLHYDVAGHTMARQLDALLTLTDRNHLHYGSDWPFTPEPVAAAAAQRLAPLNAELRANTDALLRRHA